MSRSLAIGRRHIFIQFIIVLILPLLGMSVLSNTVVSRNLNRTIVNDARERLAGITDNGAVRIQEFMDGTEFYLGLLAEMIGPLSDFSDPEDAMNFETLLAGTSEYLPASTRLTIESRTTDPPGWSEIRFDSDRSERVIAFNAPLDGAGDGDLVLQASFPIEDFRQILEDIPYEISEYAFLAAPDNTIILHPSLDYGTDLGAIPGEDLSPLTEAFGNRRGTVEYEFRNDRKVLGHQRLDNGWTIVVTARQEDLLAVAAESRNLTVVFNVISVIIFLAVSLVLVRIVTTPVSRIISAVRTSMADAEVIPELPGLMDRNDEFGELARRFRELQINNRRMIDRLLEENLDKERLSSLGDRLAEVSHEVEGRLGTANTGVSHVQRALESLSADFKEGRLSQEGFESFIEDQREALAIAARSLTDSIQLMRSVKNTSAGQTHILLEDLNLRDLIEDVIVGMKPAMKRYIVDIQNAVPKNMVILGYSGYLIQVLENLIRNSLKHGFERDRKGTIRISADDGETQAVIEYSDDGTGIDTEARDKVFDRFYTTAKGKGGTGIGLYLVKSIIETQCRGEIELVDDDRPGVRFRISLPNNRDAGLGGVTPA